MVTKSTRLCLFVWSNGLRHRSCVGYVNNGSWMIGSCLRIAKRFAMVADQSTDVLAIIIKCVNFAAVKHKNQRRRDPEKTPYINHVIGKKIMEQRVITQVLKLQVSVYARLRFCI